MPGDTHRQGSCSERIAFRMQLHPGQRLTYKARHDGLWPQRAALLRDAGISDYSIFLHEPSGGLFAVLRRTPDHGMERLPEHEIMQTDADGAPISEPLPLLFHLD